MVNAPTPWAVQTTKRKSLASVPNPRERRRTFQNVEDGLGSVRCRPHQQTLTQIQFVPRRPQDDRNDEVETRTTMTKRAQVRRNGGRVQKRNSTLTQMDFLATSTFHDNDEDGLTPLPDDGDIQDGERGFMQLDGSGDLPNPRRQQGTPFAGKSMSKRKSTPVVSQESRDFRPPQKKRKTNGEATADNSEHRRRTSSRVASVKATRSISLLSARYGEDHGDISESFETPSIGPRAAAAPHEQRSPALLQGPSWPAWDQQNQPPSPHKIPRASFPRTPSKKKDVVPSSRSPDSLPSGTWRRNGRGADNHVLSQERSPLKERSVNVQLSRWRRDSKESSLNCLQRPSPPKRKIRVLKHPRHKLQQERAPVENVKAVPKNSRWILSSLSPKLEESEKPLVIPIPEVRDSNEDSEPSQPTTQLLQSLMMEVEDSVEEDDIETPRTSQLSRQRALVSSRGTMQIQERASNIRELLGLGGAREEATSLQETKKENSPGHSDIAMKNIETDYAQGRAPQSPKMGFKQDKPRSVKSPGAAYVADSEEEEGSVFALSPGSSIANSTQFNAELAERIPTSSADATPSPPATPSRRKSFSPSSQLNHEIELSLPRPRLAHQPNAYSTTTKVIPLNDTSSSPSMPLPSNPRTVYPASLPRPSQVSTQDATQPYLPLLSTPLAPVSSPTGSRPATITIKDSSSALRPLRDIPWERHSQSQPQSQLDVKVGLDDCLDAEDDDKLNKEVAATCDEADPGIDYQQESQVVPQPLQTSRARGKGEVRSWTTEQGSPVRKRRPRKPVIPPEVRAVLGESCLESVPGPPGWSQRSWDDELL